MRHAVIVAHPNPASFTGSLASAYREEGAARGQEVMVRDLYGMRFDPCLQESEMPWSKHFALRGDVIAERELLKDVDVFALFYPLWLNLPPAILKGYLERVFVMDSAHHPGGADNASPSKPRKLISVTSSGAPTDWVIRTGALQTMREQFDGYFAGVCGLEVVDHLHFGAIVPGIRADAVEADRQTVRKAFARHFG